jgi:hypothetical protein
VTIAKTEGSIAQKGRLFNFNDCASLPLIMLSNGEVGTEPSIQEKDRRHETSESVVHKDSQELEPAMRNDTTDGEREGNDAIDHGALKGSGSETSSRVLRPGLSNSSIETVVEAMRRNPRKHTVQENGCAALGHMAIMDEVNKELIVKAEGIDAIIQGKYGPI